MPCSAPECVRWSSNETASVRDPRQVGRAASAVLARWLDQAAELRMAEVLPAMIACFGAPMRNLSDLLFLCSPAASSRPSSTTSCSKAAESWIRKPASTPSATSASVMERSPRSPRATRRTARHSRRRTGRRARLHRSASARARSRQPARQGLRRSDHRARNGNRRTRRDRNFLKSKEGHSLIHYGTTASHVAARALIFGAPLARMQQHPAEERACYRAAATPEQIAQHSATPAR